MKRILTSPVYDARTVASLLGISYSEAQIAAFGPPPQSVTGFLTFFDPGWSILWMRKVMSEKGTSPIFYDEEWYEDQPFAQREEQLCYRQLRMAPAKNSFAKTFTEQRKLLARNEEVPTARVVIMGMALHFLATGQRLFGSGYVRTADQTADGVRVRVGNFDHDGLDVGDRLDERRDDYLGLAVARKSS